MRKITVGIATLGLAALASLSLPTAAEATDFYFGISSGRPSVYHGGRSAVYSARPPLYRQPYPQYRTSVRYLYAPTPNIHYHARSPQIYHSARPSLYAPPRAVYRSPRSCYGY